MDFLGHGSGVRWENTRGPAHRWGPGPGASGAPSAGVSLVGLRPRRARLRFPRPGGSTPPRPFGPGSPHAALAEGAQAQATHLGGRVVHRHDGVPFLNAYVLAEDAL